jgi:acid phosphatase (class A)
MIDALFSTFPAKDRYVRPRPFVVNGAPICSPEYESELRQSGSYPSGHTAIGWAWALILGEIMPERGDAIIKRGRAYGENRIICNVHWYSDVVEGRIVGAAAVSRLRADPAFQADLEKARQEIAALRGKKPSPAVDCHEEAAAMAQPYALP